MTLFPVLLFFAHLFVFVAAAVFNSTHFFSTVVFVAFFFFVGFVYLHIFKIDTIKPQMAILLLYFRHLLFVFLTGFIVYKFILNGTQHTHTAAQIHVVSKKKTNMNLMRFS